MFIPVELSATGCNTKSDFQILVAVFQMALLGTKSQPDENAAPCPRRCNTTQEKNVACRPRTVSNLNQNYETKPTRPFVFNRSAMGKPIAHPAAKRADVTGCNTMQHDFEDRADVAPAPFPRRPHSPQRSRAFLEILDVIAGLRLCGPLRSAPSGAP